MSGEWPTPQHHRTYLVPSMNYLAHLFLSGDDPLVMVGNFMGDSIRGTDLSSLPERVAQGVRLHRSIDHWTDEHEASLTGRVRLYPYSSKYAGVVLDMFYDHLLASSWERFHEEPLSLFTGRCYQVLHENAHLMPQRTRPMLRYMAEGDWLSSYATLEGLARALRGLSRRTSSPDRLHGAEQVLTEHRELFQQEFEQVLSDVDALTRSMR